MLLFLLIIYYTARNLVSANPLFNLHHQQCFYEPNYNTPNYPIYFENPIDFDPYLHSASVQNPVLLHPTNQGLSFNSPLCPLNEIQASAVPFFNQERALVNPSYSPNQNFNNGIPLWNNNGYNLNQGVPLMVDNYFDVNQQRSVAVPACNSNHGRSLVENSFNLNQALPLANAPCQYQNNESLNPEISQIAATKEKNNKNSSVKKALIESLLSNPTLKTLIDPNTRLYNQNGVEIPRHVGNNGLSSPNIINNYIIVPPELIEQPNLFKHSKKKKNKSRRRKENGRLRKRKNKRKSEENDEDSQSPVSEKRRKSSKHRSRKRNKTKKGNKMASNETISLNNETNSFINVNNNDTISGDLKTHISEEKYSNTLIPLTSNISNQPPNNANLADYYNYGKILNDYQNIMSNKTNLSDLMNRVHNLNNNANGNNIAQTKHDPITKEIIKSTVNNKNEVHLTLSNVPNNREEESVKEICRKFPGIPEDVVRKLIAHLKNKLLNEQGQITYQHWPFNFKNNFPTLANPTVINSTPNVNKNNSNKGNQNKPKINNNNQKNKAISTQQGNDNRSKSSKKQTPTLKSNNADNKPKITKILLHHVNKNQTIANEKKEVNINNTEPNNTKENNTTVNVIEKTTNGESSTKPIIYIQDKIEIIDPSKKTKIMIDDIIETTTPRTYTMETNEIASFDNEGKINAPEYHGFIDDYYPDFRNENEALLFESDGYAIKNIDFDRYHYTTDRSVGASELSRETRKYESTYANSNNINAMANTEAKDDVKTSDNDNEDTVEFVKPEIMITDAKELKQEIQYITPPLLEVPDFETKKIERSNFAKRDYFDFNDKVSTYSDVKSRQNTEKLKPSKSNLDSKKHDVETISARSRVAKFGPGSSMTYDMNDDLKTIVLAESEPK